MGNALANCASAVFMVLMGIDRHLPLFCFFFFPGGVLLGLDSLVNQVACRLGLCNNHLYYLKQSLHQLCGFLYTNSLDFCSTELRKENLIVLK